MAKRTRSRATPGAALLADAAPAKKQKGGSAVDVVARAADGAAAALPQSAQENEYEQARQAQIERNKERLQALQLQALAASVLPPAPPRRAAAKKSQAKRAARAQVRRCAAGWWALCMLCNSHPAGWSCPSCRAIEG